MSVVQLLRLTTSEKSRYDDLFVVADTDRDGFIGPEDAQFFLSLGVEKKILSEIWALSDQEKKGRLTRDGFYIALRLISASRQGKPVTFESAIAATEFTLNKQENPTRPDPDSAKSEWSISTQERAKFLEIFEKADEDKDGFVTGMQARQLFGRSGLDLNELGKIWTLSDVDKDHQLNAEEFIIAMYFINARLKGRPLPDSLPPSLRPVGQPQPQQLTLPTAISPSDEQYVISAEERVRYEAIFFKADEARTGFVSGTQARQLFSRSGLPLPDLAKIWSLSDVDQDTQLNKEEFILAMYLINARLKGKELPTSLPASLQPAFSKSLPPKTPPSSGGFPAPLTPPTSGGFGPSFSSHSVSFSPSSTPPSSLGMNATGKLPSLGGSSPLSGSLTSLPSLTPPTSFGGSSSTDQGLFPATQFDVNASKEQAALLEEIGKTRLSIEEIKNLAAQQQRQKEHSNKKLRKLRAKNERVQREYHEEESALAQLTAEVKKLELEVETEQAQTLATNGKKAFTAEKFKAVSEQRDRLERIQAEKVEQHKEEAQLLSLLEAQLAEREAEVKAQKEQLDQLDKHIEALKVQRQDVKDRTVRAQEQLVEINAKLVGAREEAQRVEKELVPLVSELGLAEAAVAKAAMSPPVTVANDPPQGPTRNPFGGFEAASSFDAFPESKPFDAPPFGSSFDSFLGAAELFPAPKAPVESWPTSDTFGSPNNDTTDNFFASVSGNQLDLSVTKESFGQSNTSSGFNDGFDFTKSKLPPQQDFGVVEVKEDAHNFFGDKDSFF